MNEVHWSSNYYYFKNIIGTNLSDFFFHRIVRYKLTIASYKVRIERYKLTIASYKVRIERYKLTIAS